MKPEQLNKVLRSKAEPTVNKLEVEIDSYMVNNGVDCDGSFTFATPTDVTPQILLMLRERYGGEGGWSIAHTEKGGMGDVNLLEFAPIKPPSQKPAILMVPDPRKTVGSGHVTETPDCGSVGMKDTITNAGLHH